MNLAQLEKILANTDLNQFKTEPLKLLVKQLYKYQDYKISVVLTQINMMNFKEATVREYYAKMRSYLKNGVKHKGFKSLYEYLDEFKISGLTPLRPAEENKVKEYKKSSKPTNPSPTPQSVEPPKYIEKIPPQYGIKCGDWIRLQPNKEMALGYIECYKVIGDGKQVELVTIDLEVLNDR